MKLKAALPKGELNGLSAVHSQLIKKRGQKVLVIGAVTSHEFTDVEGKGREAKVELVRVEAVPEDLQTYIAELIERALEDRTGQTALDLEIEGTTDLRKEFRPRKAKDGPTPDLFEAPAALEAKPTRDEDIVDAEVVDEADENAAEDADIDFEHEKDQQIEQEIEQDAIENPDQRGIPADVFFGSSSAFVDQADDDETDDEDEHQPSLGE